MQKSAQLPQSAQSVSSPEKPHALCPWWLGYILASPVRKLLQNPQKLLAGHVRPGMIVLEPGPGMGFFTLELARRVGTSGRVIAVDIQLQMLEGLRRRAARAGVLENIELRQARPESLGLSDLEGAVDFTLAVAMVHEMPSAEWFFRQAAYVSKPGARLLLVEPKGHVSVSHFENELRAAHDVGFIAVESEPVRRSHSALLERAKG